MWLQRCLELALLIESQPGLSVMCRDIHGDAQRYARCADQRRTWAQQIPDDLRQHFITLKQLYFGWTTDL